MLFGDKLRVEEDERVDDLLSVEEDVKAGGQVGLMSGLHHLLHLEVVGGGEVAGGDCGLYLYY